jgi:hypothetical protein
MSILPGFSSSWQAYWSPLLSCKSQDSSTKATMADLETVLRCQELADAPLTLLPISCGPSGKLISATRTGKILACRSNVRLTSASFVFVAGMLNGAYAVGTPDSVRQVTSPQLYKLELTGFQQPHRRRSSKSSQEYPDCHLPPDVHRFRYRSGICHCHHVRDQRL